MRRSDIFSAAAVTVFGLLVLFVIIPVWVPGHEAGSYGLRAQDFPYLSAAVFTALALLLLARSLLRGRAEADEPVPIGRRSWVYLAVASAVLMVTVIALDTVGILGGGPFVVAVLMVMMGERRPLAIVGTAVIAPLALWAFFWKLLEFPLP